MRPLTHYLCLFAPGRSCLWEKRLRVPMSHQKIASLRIYPGEDSEFTLYQDNGKTYAYEKGNCPVTRLHWNDAAQQRTHQGAEAWTEPDSEIVDVLGRR